MLLSNPVSAKRPRDPEFGARGLLNFAGAVVSELKIGRRNA
jgi:hypothetical protein